MARRVTIWVSKNGSKFDKEIDAVLEDLREHLSKLAKEYMADEYREPQQFQLAADAINSFISRLVSSKEVETLAILWKQAYNAKLPIRDCIPIGHPLNTPFKVKPSPKVNEGEGKPDNRIKKEEDEKEELKTFTTAKGRQVKIS